MPFYPKFCGHLNNQSFPFCILSMDQKNKTKRKLNFYPCDVSGSTSLEQLLMFFSRNDNLNRTNQLSFTVVLNYRNNLSRNYDRVHCLLFHLTRTPYWPNLNCECERWNFSANVFHVLSSKSRSEQGKRHAFKL